MRRWLGQVDLRSVLTTVLATAIISAFGYLWTRVVKVDELDSRLTRIENALERLEDRLPKGHR